MRNYLDLLERVVISGDCRMDRTGTGTIAVFGESLSFNLQNGFPLVTTKKVHIKSIFHELLWMISGSSNIGYLQNNGVTIWNEWADENGDLGPVYGVQWRNTTQYEWNGAETVVDRDEPFVDQLQEVITSIKKNPYSRRHMVNAWNVSELREMKLPPCHFNFQFFVSTAGYLDCLVSMRSVDCFLGMPFDIALYATLTHMIAHLTGLKPGHLKFSFGDTHIYLNHIQQVKEQLSRPCLWLSKLVVNANNREIKSIDDFVFSDLQVIGYHSHPAIKGEVSV